jgi:hypothetical protein
MTRRNVVGNDGTGTDDGSLADRNALCYHDVGSDPHVSTDRNGSARVRLISIRPVLCGSMIGTMDLHSWPNKRFGADSEPPRRIDNAMRSYVYLIRYLKERAIDLPKERVLINDDGRTNANEAAFDPEPDALVDRHLTWNSTVPPPPK